MAAGRSSKFGTVNYSADEMRRLNTTMRSALPLAGEDWLRVAYQFNYMRPESVPYRDVESLKRKFKKMYCARGKTLPDYVLEAKELRKRISQRSDKASSSETAEQATGDADKQQNVEVAGIEAVRDLTLKLRQMEEEYHRALEGRRSAGENEATSTSGVIAMLRQSVARRRRTVEEQVLTESARVRRERKRRKTEQELLLIHQEQHEREPVGNGPGAAKEAEADTSTCESSPPAAAVYANHQSVPSPSGRQDMSPLSAGASASPALSTSFHLTTQPVSISSLGVMELLLQFMTAQQGESAQRLEAEQAQREQDRREREERRRQKELRRRKEHRELMLAVGALLGDRFPDSLKHYLKEE